MLPVTFSVSAVSWAPSPLACKDAAPPVSPLSPASSFSASLLKNIPQYANFSSVSQLKKKTKPKTHNPLIPSPSSAITLLFSEVFDVLFPLPHPPFSLRFTSVSFHTSRLLKLPLSRSQVTSICQIQRVHLCPQLSPSLKSIRQVDSSDGQMLSTLGCPKVPSQSPAETTGLVPVPSHQTGPYFWCFSGFTPQPVCCS